jgi:dTDP-4-amino-4,6-dideoxygalactose transaminase
MLPNQTLAMLLRRSTKSNFLALLLKHRVKKYQFFDYGSRALLNALILLDIQSGHNVLVPSYICNIAVEPFEYLGIKVRYYKTNMNLSPNLSDLEKKIAGGTRAILLVHYFGFPNERTEEIQELCRQHDIYLIEDNAHSFLSMNGSQLLGTMGDVGFSSIWKILPVRNGAILYINNSRLFHNTADARQHHLKSSFHMRDLFFLLSSLRNLVRYHTRVGSVSNFTRPYQLSKTKSTISKDYSNTRVPMSPISMKVLKTTDCNYIANRRRDNYTFWLNTITENDGIQVPFKQLHNGVCPQVFPIIHEKPLPFLKAMLSKGLSLRSWSVLPSEVRGNKEFPEANYLSKHLITIPVHQSLNPGRLRRLYYSKRYI